MSYLHTSVYIIIISSLLSCNAKKSNEDEKKEVYLYTHPITVDTTIKKEYVADIEAIKNVEIRSRIHGFIDKIHVDEGQTVTEGQLLFTINSQELKQELYRGEVQLKSAQAELKMAELELNNIKTLVDKNIVSSTEYELSKAKYELAESKVKQAESQISSIQLNISFSYVKAPFSGIINRLPLKAGSLIDNGALLTTISNTSEIYAYFNLSEKEYLNMLKRKQEQHTQNVHLLLADGSMFSEIGNIETSESEINKSTGNIAFRARFKNPEKVLKHGSSGKLLLPTILKKALIIPQKATFEIQENTYVLTANNEGIVKMQKVKISHTLPYLFVVESGISNQDKIIVEGIQTLKEGDKIELKMESFEKVMNP